MHRFTPGTRLDRWLFQILRSIWISDRRRAVQQRTDALEDHPEPMGGPDGVRVTESRLTLSEVQERFSSLSHDQQQALLLVCVEGYSYAEAAQLLNIPMGTIMSRLARGRAGLMAMQAMPTADNVAIFQRKAR
jgi:RNA polymerase sigma-70 factor (ECF subfamily)